MIKNRGLVFVVFLGYAHFFMIDFDFCSECELISTLELKFLFRVQMLSEIVSYIKP